MKKRILALVLASALCMAGGCSTAKSDASPAETDNATAADSASAAFDASQSSVPMESSSDLDKAITYPLANPNSPIEITTFTAFPPIFSQWVSTFNDLPRMPDVLAATGIKFTFVEVSSAAASTQFNLMIAGGDWTDVIQPTDYYVGGLSAAYADGVIADLTDIIPTAAPDYYDYLMNKTNEDTIDTLLTDGKSLAMYGLKTAPFSDSGMIMRSDWLEALGLTAPKTFDEFTNVLYAMHDKYNGTETLYQKPDGAIACLDNVFQTSLFNIKNATTVAPFRNGVTVVSGMVTDGYRQYLEYFNKLYTDKIIAEDFYSVEDTDIDKWGMVGNGQCGVWSDFADAMDKPLNYGDEPDMKVEAAGKFVKNAGDKYTFGASQVLADNKGWSITTECENPDIVCSFFNYFFTDSGTVMANYGKEGESFTYDSDGKPQFTDMIMHNSDQTLNSFVAIILYSFSQCPTLNDISKMWGTYTEQQLNAIKLWSDTDNETTEHAMPAAVALTTEQTTVISTTMSDVIGYASEAVLKFMTGETPITDDTWNEYVKTCKDLGLEKCVKEYQVAYDKYLAGKKS